MVIKIMMMIPNKQSIISTKLFGNRPFCHQNLYQIIIKDKIQLAVPNIEKYYDYVLIQCQKLLVSMSTSLVIRNKEPPANNNIHTNICIDMGRITLDTQCTQNTTGFIKPQCWKKHFLY